MQSNTIIKSDIKNVLTFVAPLLPANPIIIEAGAFKGAGTFTMSRWWPDATIHAFEPVPELFVQLQDQVKDQKNVICYPYALGEHDGMATFYVGEKTRYPGLASQSGSVLKPKERLKWSSFMMYPRTIEVSMVTLDGWARKHKVHQIDFFWLDVQGYSLNVLKEAQEVLQSTRVLYTEVEFIEAYEHQHYYEEVKSWLETRGFVMVACDFTEQQSWFFGNVVFVNKKFIKE